MLKSLKNGKFYVGISDNVTRRLGEHNRGKLKTTSRNVPHMVVFLKEYLDYKSARKHESWLKKKSIVYNEKIVATSWEGPRLSKAG